MLSAVVPRLFILHNWCQYGRGENRKGDAAKALLVHTLCFAWFLRDFYRIGIWNFIYRQFFTQYHEAIRQFGAIMLILFGLITAGVFQPKFMMKERRIHFKRRPEGFIGSVLIGLAFAAGCAVQLF